MEKVLDVGSVFCEGHKLEKAQQELGETVQQLNFAERNFLFQ